MKCCLIMIKYKFVQILKYCCFFYSHRIKNRIEMKTRMEQILLLEWYRKRNHLMQTMSELILQDIYLPIQFPFLCFPPPTTTKNNWGFSKFKLSSQFGLISLFCLNYKSLKCINIKMFKFYFILECFKWSRCWDQSDVFGVKSKGVSKIRQIRLLR